MKKSIIAGAGVMALAAAAMPFAGVFAETTSTPVTQAQDTVTVTVEKGCSIVNTRANQAATFSGLVPGNVANLSTDPIQLTCNAAWTVSVEATDMKGATNTTEIIAPAADADLDGIKSGWGLKLAPTPDSGNTITTNNFANFNAVDGTNKVTGDGAVKDLQLTPTYKVSLKADQKADTYSSTVTYRVAAN